MKDTILIISCCIMYLSAHNNKHEIKVTVTAYTSHKNQTDSTPFIGAWNNNLKGKKNIIAVSRDLIKYYNITNGSKVYIKEFKKIYTVRDKMNKRFKKRIDIYMGLECKKALKFGIKEVTIWKVNF